MTDDSSMASLCFIKIPKMLQVAAAFRFQLRESPVCCMLMPYLLHEVIELPKKHASLVRRDDYTGADLLKWADQLARLQSELLASHDVMKAENLDTIRVDGATKITRGLKLIAEFSGNVTRAIKSAQYG
jgi:hypothetical protein